MERQALPFARPELVAPAGTPKKLKTAFRFGADAVYLGLERYSMRAQAGNFALDELEWALGYAHAREKKVFVALNIQPFDDDFEGLESTLRTLAALGPDAVIVADAGVVALARQVAPNLRLHLSTQASVTNARAARFWASQGLERIVVARELDLEKLGTLVAGADVDIEAFAHGAVCIAYSGRCLLSLYWAGEERDPRRGGCSQACRWRYRELEDRRRPGEGNPIEQDERGTYFFDAKDLCTIPLLDRLLATGVRALKLEGRTRSAHYLASTIDVYRHATERLAAGDVAGFSAAKEEYIAELMRPSKRELSTHFLGGEQDSMDAYNPKGPTKGPADAWGELLRNDGDRVLVELSNPVEVGQGFEVRDVGLSIERGVVRMTSEDGGPLERARAGTRVWLDGRFRATEGAIVRPSGT
jgi:putative protease